MSLPMPWVEKIFLKLTLTFGREFTDRWDESSLQAVKEDWAHELRGFQQNPGAIAYGLEHCIAGKPPTVQEFKSACSRKPDSTPLLPSPVVDPVIAARVLEGLRESAKPKPSMKDWAYRLKGRHEAGDKLNRNQIACYQAAIGETSCAT
jgi:hypothetical protein